MITCPWCGTSYTAFQPNCQRCGGPIPAPAAAARTETRLAAPPPAPREISDNFAWRLMMSDGGAIAAFVLLLLGGIFLVTGIPLIIGIVTAFLGIPFTLAGAGMFAAGWIIGSKRLQAARTRVQVLREGNAVQGEIRAVDANYAVQVNGRNPWTIRYGFALDGQEYEGQVTTLSQPLAAMQAGNPAYVLYLPGNPAANSLYPHP